MDLVNHTREAGGVERFGFAFANFKVGLLNKLDLQVVSETYNLQRGPARAADERETISGFGDLLVRLKVNIWGNDGGKTAFGMMSFVKFPTNQHGLGNSATEGGIIFPLAVELPGEFSLGMMTELDTCGMNRTRATMRNSSTR